jgi:hypothetical protein
VILIDGDIVAYRCAYKSRDDRAEYAAHSAGSYLSDLISDLYILIEDEPEYRVFLTGKGNFRHEYAVTAGYKDAVKFLYEQILTGDRADNIMGIKGVGPVKAKKALADCVTERQMYDVCVEMYGDEERVIENGRLLYLRRKEGEIWNAPNAE